jgi:hypothetical protein
LEDALRAPLSGPELSMRGFAGAADPSADNPAAEAVR